MVQTVAKIDYNRIEDRKRKHQGMYFNHFRLNEKDFFLLFVKDIQASPWALCKYFRHVLLHIGHFII